MKTKKAVKSIKKTSKAKKPAINNNSRIAELENIIIGLQMRLDLAEAAIQAIRDGNPPVQKWPTHPWPAWPTWQKTWQEWPIYSGIRTAGG